MVLPGAIFAEVLPKASGKGSWGAESFEGPPKAGGKGRGGGGKIWQRVGKGAGGETG